MRLNERKFASGMRRVFLVDIPAVLLSFFATLMIVSLLSSSEAPESSPEPVAAASYVNAPEPQADVETVPEIIVTPPKIESPDTALDDFMDLCEARIDVVTYDPETGLPVDVPERVFSFEERDRVKRHIKIVADEMGADPKLLMVWALRESSYRPYKRHRLNPDMEAALAAWNRFRYSEARERKLQDIMENSSAKDGTRDYWLAKASLSRINIYRDNPTYEAKWRWSTGYGLYGMQPVYHVRRWDTEAPPEILCDPVVATVVAVWAARTVQANCESQGFDGTYETVNRGYSSGHCAPSSRDVYFRKRASRIGLDPDRQARLGQAWPQKTSDRDEVLAYMRSKLEEDDVRIEQDRLRRASNG